MLALQRFHADRRARRALGHRVGRIPKPLRPRYPVGVEALYRIELQKMVAEARASTERLLIPKLSQFKKAAGSSGVPQRDDWSDDIDAVLQMVEASYGETFGDDEVEDVVRPFAQKLNEFNRRDMARVLAAIGGIDLAGEAWLAPQLNSFVDESVSDIQSIPDKLHAEVTKIVTSGVRQGLTTEDLADQIRERFDVADSKAALIARDQTAQFNGDLTKARQVHAGITKYTWSGVLDDRERDSHLEQEGKVFSWSGGGAPGIGHPGDDYQCRCVAIPIFDEPKDDDEDED